MSGLIRLGARFLRDENGATAIEYAIIAGTLSIVIVTAVSRRHQRECMFTTVEPASSDAASSKPRPNSAPKFKIPSLTSLQPTPVRTCSLDGECHGFARRAHALCRLVVDGRPADAGGDARPDARRHRSVAGGEPAGCRPARARAVLLRQPPHHVPDPGDRGADRDLVPAAAPHPPHRAGGVRRQPRARFHDAGLRRGGEGRAALAHHPRRQHPAVGIPEARLRDPDRLAVR